MYFLFAVLCWNFLSQLSLWPWYTGFGQKKIKFCQKETLNQSPSSQQLRQLSWKREQGCRCETTKLFYTSEDVFQGTSPVTKHKSALGDLCSKDALLLKNILLEIKKKPANRSFEDLMDKFEINDFSEEIRNKAISLAEQAYQHSQSKW